MREAVGHLLESFQRTGSARSVVKQFATDGLRFPGRHISGPHAGELYWRPLRYEHVLSVLHNPRYAGAYCFGRRRQQTAIDGRAYQVLKPREEWTVLILDAHPAYISFQQWERNQATLAQNAAARGTERHAGPPREGPALLQGLAICGKCGKRMSVGYHKRSHRLVPDYVCRPGGGVPSQPPCQNVCGADIDAAVAALVLQTLSPLAIETALQVSAELQQRAADTDRIRATAVKRAQYAADAARRRYLAVDPTNRLVADTLEADWNAKLRELQHAQDEYERATQAGDGQLTDEHKARVRALASDLPALFNDPATPTREKKRLIRLLVCDATLTRATEQITVQVRLSGGQLHTLTIPRPLQAWEAHKTPASTIALIEQLLAEHTHDEAVEILNQRGITGGWGRPFTVASVSKLCHDHHIPDLRQRLRAQGMLTLEEIAAQLGVTTRTIKRWRARGHITGRRIDGRYSHLYHPGQTPPDSHARTTTSTPTTTIRTHHHHQPALAREGVTTTNPPGGAV